MYSHLCCTKQREREIDRLLVKYTLQETQKVGGDEDRLMCGPLPKWLFS